MNLHFFLVCFGILGCYAVFRTAKRGWLKVAMALLAVFSIIHLTFNAFYPKPGESGFSQQMLAGVPIQVPHMPAATGLGARAHTFVAEKLEGIEKDRCLMSIAEETPIGVLVYAWEARTFLRNYQQAPMGSGVLASASHAASTTFAPNQGPPTTCDRVMQWTVNQAGSGVSDAVKAGSAQLRQSQ